MGQPQPIATTGRSSGAGRRARPPDASADAIDRALVRRVAAGEMPAFEELYGRYARRVGGYLWKMLRRSELVDEVLDDVMMVVWQKADRFDLDGRFSSWLFGIAHNKALTALERERRHVRNRAHGDDDDTEARIVSEAPDPESVAESRDELGALRRGIERLPPDQRSVVELTFFSGLSYPEIAEAMDCPVGTVKTRMFHARKQLARFMR